MGWSGNSCTTAIHKSFIMHWLSLGVASFLVTDTVMGVRIVFGDLGDKLVIPKSLTYALGHVSYVKMIMI